MYLECKFFFSFLLGCDKLIWERVFKIMFLKNLGATKTDYTTIFIGMYVHVSMC